MLQEIVIKYKETGDTKYIGEMYNMLYGYLKSHLLRKFGKQLTVEDIQDIINDMFIDMDKTIKSYDSDKCIFKTYIYKSSVFYAFNRLANMKRKSNRENIYYRESNEESVSPEINITYLLSLIDIADKKDIDKRVFKSYLTGLTYVEISDMYNIKLNTVRSKIHNFRRDVFRDLKEYQEYKIS